MTEPFLLGAVDLLYHAVMDQMPKWAQDRDMASANVLGFVGAYSLTKLAQFVVRTEDSKWIPALERLVATALTAGPIAYAAFDLEGAKEIMTMHPTYTSGMTGVYLGSMAGLLQDLRRRSKKQTLEDYTNYV